MLHESPSLLSGAMRPVPSAVPESELNGGAAPTKRLLTPEQYAEKLFNVARKIATRLQVDVPLDKEQRKAFRAGLKTQLYKSGGWMAKEFGGDSNSLLWNHKDVYEAEEIALVMLLHSAARSIKNQQWSPPQVLNYLRDKQDLCLTHSSRSAEQEKFQQFSTPLPLAYIAMRAARVSPNDVFVEPSAGTGIIATMAKLNGAEVIVNDLSDKRHAILGRIFDPERTFKLNAEQLHDRLPLGIKPSVIIANPPFSHSPGLRRANTGTTLKHLKSALDRLSPGGRMVFITGENFKPGSKTWGKHFPKIQEQATVIGSFAVDKQAFAKHGTTFAARVTVFDKVPAPEPNTFVPIGNTPLKSHELLREVHALPPRHSPEGARLVYAVPDRPPAVKHAPPRQATPRPVLKKKVKPLAVTPAPVGIPVGQEPKELPPAAPEIAPEPTPVESPPVEESPKVTRVKRQRTPAKAKAIIEKTTAAPTIDLTDVVDVEYRVIGMPVNDSGGVDDTTFERYKPKRIEISGAHPHPTDLVESQAMSVVLPPEPSYKPVLPKAVIAEGVLSDAQIETVTYAGNAHQGFLNGYFLVTDDGETTEPTVPSNPDAVQFRRGYFLGDGTGCGKGRQVAGIIMDNVLQGRKKAVWVSMSKTLQEDAKRDWEALGGNPDDVHLQGSWKINQSIELPDGILFTTYSTLRSTRSSGGNHYSRLQQISDWLGDDFDGCIAFDEAHNMGGAVGKITSMGVTAPSQQGLAGLKIQNLHPDARVIYVSATGATEVSHLAYASRLGLWSTGEFPFESRGSFISQVDAGGQAAMEMVARDIKALGLYNARVLSFDGVENEPLEVSLTDEQKQIYNKFADAFYIIHHNLQEALQVAGVVSPDGYAYNSRAKAAAISVFEGTRQRFFNHLLTSMKTPEMIEAIENDLAQDRSCVIQIVSTNEAILDRKLSAVPVGERDNLQIDFTPREGILEYLDRSFPTTLFEPYEDEYGNIRSRIVKDTEDNPVQCQRALEMKEDLIKELMLLPEMPGALEQILFHFGKESVAEVTGRSQRILYDHDSGRYHASKRGARANSEETKAFQSGEKRILVFSQAGGTGRSYHASLACQNQQRRVHYLLEPGWNAATAIQGFGRTHRTHQASAPIVRVVSTDVLGERRFTATISRRIGQLGALTRGQRDAAGQGVFTAENNLESDYAKYALSLFYHRMAQNRIEGMSCAEFEDITGLALKTREGAIKADMPPMSRFLNRMLALPIEKQNFIFGEFEALHMGAIEAAKESGKYDKGVKALRDSTFTLVGNTLLYTHPTTESTTTCLELDVKTKVSIISSDAALTQAKKDYPDDWYERLYQNAESKNAAIRIKARPVTNKHGVLEERVGLLRPNTTLMSRVDTFEASNWRKVLIDEWKQAWDAQVAKLPTHTESKGYLVSGLLLPVWDTMSQEDPTVYKIELTNGERVLGRMIAPESVEEISKAMGVSADISLTPAEVYNTVLHDGSQIPLGSGYALKRSMVEQQYRIEVTGKISDATAKLLEQAGCQYERIRWDARYFIPVDDEGVIGTEIVGNVMELFGRGIRQ